MTEWEELVIYISDMKKKFNQKLQDHIYIIEQQNMKIDEQNQMIHELAWQLRDLRNVFREFKSKQSSKSCSCDIYENHFVEKANKKDKKALKLCPAEFNLIDKLNKEKNIIIEPTTIDPKRDWHKDNNKNTNPKEIIIDTNEDNKSDLEIPSSTDGPFHPNDVSNEEKKEKFFDLKFNPLKFISIENKLKLLKNNKKVDEKNKNGAIFYIGNIDDENEDEGNSSNVLTLGNNNEKDDVIIRDKSLKQIQRKSSTISRGTMPDIKEEDPVIESKEISEQKKLEQIAYEIFNDCNSNTSSKI